MNRTELLKGIPLFDGLNAQELEEISELFREASLLKGDTICREGEEGDSLYIVLSGELEVWAGREGERRVLNRMVPGDFFGEISLLTGETRTATVTVSRDARLLIVDRRTFETFLQKNAKMLEQLSRVLAHRLARVSRGEVTGRSTNVISVIAPPGIKGKSLTASVLVGLLADFTRKRTIHVGFVVVDRGSKASKKPPLLKDLAGKTKAATKKYCKVVQEGAEFLEIGIYREHARSDIRSWLGALLEGLNQAFEYVVLDACGESKALMASAAASSDVVIRIEGPGDLVTETTGDGSLRVFSVINRLNGHVKKMPINHVEPFVLPVDRSLDGMDPAAQSRYIRRHPRAPIARPLHRLARKILGTTVGLALGGGAAFGIAHVGVIKALEENQVPIDLLAGTSMGSIVALGYAAGLSGSDMVDIANRVGTWRKTLSALDVTLTRPGFLRGNRIIQIFSPLLGDKVTFEDLDLPCRTVAADVQSGERVTIHSGPLDMAFRASCSVPLVLSPVLYQGRALVDGAVVDPVPAEVVREMGADVCVAVNVVPQLRKGVDTVLSAVYRHANRLNPLSYLSKERTLPNLLDVLMNSLQTLQYELGNFKAISADVRINPDLSGHTWMEFYKPMQFIEKGAKAAEQALPEIRAAIAGRLQR